MVFVENKNAEEWQYALRKQFAETHSSTNLTNRLTHQFNSINAKGEKSVFRLAPKMHSMYRQVAWTVMEIF